MRIAALALLAATAFAGGCQSQPEDAGTARAAATDSARLVNAASEPQNWLSHGGTYAEQRFANLDQINSGNVGRLKLAWFHDLDTNRGQEGTPLIVDGVMYATTAWSKVYALDAASGRALWRFDPKVPGKFGVSACCDVNARGAAYDDGRLFIGTVDGRLIALNAKTGKQLWSTLTVDQSKPYTISGAPRVARGKVFIGNSGADYGVRGYVSAYDAATGKLAWRFYTVPGKPGTKDNAASDDVLEKSRGTWFGDNWWKIGGGGTVWDSIVYDPALHRLYIGVGNGSPWNRVIRSQNKGDNLFLSSIVALDADTGKYIWHYQETPGETWDFTATQQIVMATLPIAGKPTDVLLHAPKNGFFYVIDRRSGRLISAEKFVPVNWADRIDLATGRPVENPAARFQQAPFLATSGGFGAHNWQPMAFSPKTRLVYIPAQQVPMLYKQDAHFAYRPGLLNMGADFSGKLPEKPAEIAALKKAMEGRLIAWDPVAQKEAWRAEHDGPGNGGVLATGGNLVFQGLADQTFRAYDAANGRELWKFPTQNAVLGGPVSFSVNGTQYIAVMAGNGGALTLATPYYGARRPAMNGRILVFKLDGAASLPALPPISVAPFEPSGESFSPQQVVQGEGIFLTTCSVCHGAGARSSGVLPDLRRSAAMRYKALWQQIVIDGALQDQGMVSFKRWLTPAQAEAVRAYVNDRSRAAKTTGE